MTPRYLATTLALHDVDDAEGFVAATIKRAALNIGSDEREELMLEGLALLVDLANRFKPRLEGHQQDGRFSGYAAQMLPRRLGDAWHRMHPEHRYVTNRETGRREWHYDLAPVSLDGISSGEGRYRRGGLGGENFSENDDMGNGLDLALGRARRIHEFIPIPIPSRAL